MIDLADSTEGQLGDGTWFSDLLYSAAHSRFTGGVLVQADGSDRTVFFREGAPVYAGGSGFTGHHIGEMLIASGHCDRDELSAALEQQKALGESGALIGTLLVASASISPEDIKEAVRLQVAARMKTLLPLESGTYRAAPGESPRIREIGVKTEMWQLFFASLQSKASDGELKGLAADLLGHSVRVKAELLPKPYEPPDDARRLLQYLVKPRKPDQLERAMRNRKLVRGTLRALSLIGALEKLPVKKGIPIPKATLLKGQRAIVNVDIVREAEPRAQTPLPRRSSSVKKPNKPHPIVKEVEKLHASLKDTSHFEKLGATPKTTPGELRSLFTVLAKKYHPDAFPTEVPDEIKVKAREVSAALNEAYNTLSSEEKREEYEALLADDRIKGDARKAELIRAAEMKNKMGAVMLKKREYKQARDFFEYAMEADPSSAEYKANYAWSLFADPEVDRAEGTDQAYELLLEALRIGPPMANIHYYMGQVLKSQGKVPEAEHHFREAVRHDKRHQDAGRELRLLRMRKKNEISEDRKKGGGALSKLFKRS